MIFRKNSAGTQAFQDDQFEILTFYVNIYSKTIPISFVHTKATGIQRESSIFEVSVDFQKTSTVVP